MNVQEIKDLISSLRQANPSLVNLGTVCDELDAFVTEAEYALDLTVKIDDLTVKIDGLTSQIRSLQTADKDLTSQIRTLQTVDKDLNSRMGNVESVLQYQKDQLFLTDEEYRGLLKQIQTVLVGLEDYLRRHT